LHFSRRATAVTISATALGALLAGAVATPAFAVDAPILTTTTPAAKTLTLPSGDGFADGASIEISSSAALTLNVDIVNDSGVVTSLDPLTLAASGSAFVGTKSIVLPDILPGLYNVRFADSVSADGTADLLVPLTVGSGTPTVVSEVVSGSTFYPYKDGFKDSIPVSIVAKDETGTTLPISGGAVSATVGTKTVSIALPTIAHNTHAAARSAILPITSLPVGHANVVATVVGPAGDGGASSAKTVTLASSALTAIGLSANYTTVYPKVDRFRDSATLTVSPKTAVAGTVPVKGTVVITNSKKSKVLSWTLTSSATRHLVWNGLSSHKLKTGTYTVTTTTTAGGKKLVKAIKIAVSAKKLVRVTKKTTKTAHSVIPTFYPFDSAQLGTCTWNTKSKSVSCKSGAVPAESGLPGSLLVYGEIATPASLLAYRSYGATSVRISAKVSSLKGGGGWYYEDGPSAKDGFEGKTALGTHALGWLHLVGPDYKSVGIAAYLHNNSSATYDKFTIEYSYLVLK
jgi:hypothetical protein